MMLQIFNVGHGFCALLRADNGNVMLFDCGHDDSFRPSRYLPTIGCTSIQKLVITNFDHDHVSDLHNVRNGLPIQVPHRNSSIPAEQLRRLKLEAGPLTAGLEAALDLHAEYVHPVPNPPDFVGIEHRTYSNNWGEFGDTNNLSLVSFLFFDGLGIVIPGDLERAGWETLFRRVEFQHDLARTNIFVASHHGRESGYCPDVFRWCSPHIVVISDEAMQYQTQETAYGRHATGLTFGDGSRRVVLTTRRDGHITISKRAGEPYLIRTSTAAPPR